MSFINRLRNRYSNNNNNYSSPRYDRIDYNRPPPPVDTRMLPKPTVSRKQRIKVQVSKFVATIRGVWNAISSFVLEPLTLITLAFTFVLFVASLEKSFTDAVSGVLLQFSAVPLITNNISIILKFIAGNLPLLSISGNTRWIAMGISSGTVFVMSSEYLVAYAIVATMIGIAFAARSAKVGAIVVLIAVASLFAFHHKYAPPAKSYTVDPPLNNFQKLYYPTAVSDQPDPPSQINTAPPQVPINTIPPGSDYVMDPASQALNEAANANNARRRRSILLPPAVYPPTNTSS